MIQHTKIVATLGPASNSVAAIRALVAAGATVFRLNFSHGSHADHQRRFQAVRQVERELGTPMAVLLDLQGPKLRVGRFEAGRATLETGQTFTLDANQALGSTLRVQLPHPEVFAGLHRGDALLIDDGKLRLEVTDCGADFAHTRVVVGGVISDCKGVNLPSSRLAGSVLTAKDRNDLAFGLGLGVDWVALSFVQHADDVHELRELVQGRALIIAKLEKPLAIEHLEAIVAAADALMVARGDLGVEVPCEEVPQLQRRIVRACRVAGKPVVVATQMLESMINTPVPTRAEASDVATAVYDGVDAVMLSAETASGKFPTEAVAVMQRIIKSVEADPLHRQTVRAIKTPAESTPTDAIGAAIRTIAETVQLSATVTYTTSGASALRVAHERPHTPIIGLTPRIEIARRLCLVWGVQPQVSNETLTLEDMVLHARAACARVGWVAADKPFAIVAGMPFGTPGSTNTLRLVWPT
jgi:pyruvate kinase